MLGVERLLFAAKKTNIVVNNGEHRGMYGMESVQVGPSTNAEKEGPTIFCRNVKIREFNASWYRD